MTAQWVSQLTGFSAVSVLLAYAPGGQTELNLLAFVLGQGDSSRLDRRVKEELPGVRDRLFRADIQAPVGKRVGRDVDYAHHERPLKRQLERAAMEEHR